MLGGLVPGDRVGAVLGGTYRLERLIGEGGMGSVYEASHQRLPRRFAVKLLNPEVVGNREVLDRFQREAEIASSIGHDNIVQVFDFNYEDGIPYMVLELLRGEDLGQRRRVRQRLSVAETASILMQVSSALEAAHSHGVIHRDLKPSNIYLCARGDRDDFVKLLDFGISKVLDAQGTGQTRTGLVLGTPNYMSPEQAEGRQADIDYRTDIFSLGAIIYECLTGKKAFQGPTPIGTIYQVVHSFPESIVTFAPETPPLLEPVLAKAMAKRREDRYHNARQLAEEFVRAASGLAPGLPPQTFAPPPGFTPPPRYAGGGPPYTPAPMTPYPQRDAPGTPPPGSPLTPPSSPGLPLTAPPSVPGVEPGQLAGGAVPNVRPTVSLKASSPTPGPAQTPAPSWGSAQVAFGGGQPISAVQEAPPRRSRRMLIAMAVTLVLAGAVVAVVLATRSGGGPEAGAGEGPATAAVAPGAVPDAAPEPALAAAAADAAPASPEPTPPATPTTVKITLKVEPRGARITLDGTDAVPGTIELPRSETPHVLEASAPGYEAQTRELVAMSDQEVSLSLKRKRSSGTGTNKEPKKVKIKGPVIQGWE